MRVRLVLLGQDTLLQNVLLPARAWLGLIDVFGNTMMRLAQG